jgi:hypothetical protein
MSFQLQEGLGVAVQPSLMASFAWGLGSVPANAGNILIPFAQILLQCVKTDQACPLTNRIIMNYLYNLQTEREFYVKLKAF